MTQLAKLALEDGTVLFWKGIWRNGEVDGEVCFNTSMTGYQEILTDPSYRGQIVTMTYPEIGNYGVNSEDVESHKPHLAGFIVREQSRRASNFSARTASWATTLRRTASSPSRGSTPGRWCVAFARKAPCGACFRVSTWTTRAWWPRPRPARAWSAAIWSAR